MTWTCFPRLDTTSMAHKMPRTIREGMIKDGSTLYVWRQWLQCRISCVNLVIAIRSSSSLVTWTTSRTSWSRKSSNKNLSITILYKRLIISAKLWLIIWLYASTFTTPCKISTCVELLSRRDVSLSTHEKRQALSASVDTRLRLVAMFQVYDHPFDSLKPSFGLLLSYCCQQTTINNNRIRRTTP